MQVEVNEANIDRYELVKLTGNTREFLLSQAAEATANGTVLSCQVPDELVLEQNVFDVYQDEHVDPRRVEGCRYDQSMDGVWMCVVHGEPSKYEVDSTSEKPCYKIDPLTVPALDNFTGKSCSYSKVTDAIQGTSYFCLIHGQSSKYDVANNPGLPCKAVDPE
jgi:hypothetical protein